VVADFGIERIVLVHRGSSFEAQQVLQNHLSSRPAIEVRFGTEVVEIKGDGGVSEVVLSSGGATETLAVHGVFPYIGLKPNTDWLDDAVTLDAGGHIVTDIMMATSVPGIWAAGDIRANSAAQLAASAGDGATAAVAAVRYLRAKG
jgi:thioredoxin reductase (NADPH)